MLFLKVSHREAVEFSKRIALDKREYQVNIFLILHITIQSKRNLKNPIMQNLLFM